MRFTPPSTTAPGAADLERPVTLRWRPARGPLSRRLGSAALTALAALGVVSVLAALAGLLFGVTPLIVRSGSMSPGLPVGSLALARSVPASSVVEGEVVSVVRADGSRVTHRVVASEETTTSIRRLTLQGDANSVADEPVLVARVDRVMASAPRLGTILQALVSPPVHFAAGLATGVALLWAFGPPTARSLGTWVPEPDGSGRRLGRLSS